MLLTLNDKTIQLLCASVSTSKLDITDDLRNHIVDSMVNHNQNKGTFPVYSANGKAGQHNVHWEISDEVYNVIVKFNPSIACSGGRKISNLKLAPVKHHNVERQLKQHGLLFEQIMPNQGVEIQAFVGNKISGTAMQMVAYYVDEKRLVWLS